MPAELDPVDRLLLDELGEVPAGRVAVLGDDTGALATALVEHAGDRVVAHCDSLVAERRVARALAGAAVGGEAVPTLAEALTDAALVVLRLPKSLDALDEIARTATLLGTADPDTIRGLGGNDTVRAGYGADRVLGGGWIARAEGWLAAA